MPIEVVHEYGGDGEYLGWYTESAPERYVKEEPDCYECNDTGCPACDGSKTSTASLQGLDRAVDSDGWGGYSDVSPF